MAMKNKVLSLVLASVLSLQGMAQAARQDTTIVRHDLVRLDQALAEAEQAIHQKKEASTESVERALIKARQEIWATRVGTEDKEVITLLVDLDKSLESLHRSLRDYNQTERLSQRLSIVSMMLLMISSGALARLIDKLSSSRADELLVEITQTRKSLAKITPAL